jgi:tetratricopeptide (TPR) repeat protein
MNEYHEAIPYLIESLLLIDPELCTVSHDVAIHNLIIAISLDETLNFTTLKDLLAGLDRAGRSLSRKSPIFRLKRKWAGALIDLRLGMNNKAFSTLLGVRRELKRLRRSSVELAMVSIDMAQACIELGSFDRACEMLEKALKLLTEIEGVNPCAVASLGACLEALRANQFEIENLQVARRALLGSNTDNTDVRRECNMPMQYLSD